MSILIKKDHLPLTSHFAANDSSTVELRKVVCCATDEDGWEDRWWT